MIILSINTTLVVTVTRVVTMKMVKSKSWFLAMIARECSDVLHHSYSKINFSYLCHPLLFSECSVCLMLSLSAIFETRKFYTLNPQCGGFLLSFSCWNYDKSRCKFLSYFPSYIMTQFRKENGKQSLSVSIQTFQQLDLSKTPFLFHNLSALW